ncbi:MAG: succinylglutamate desuccinylase/aspartoacylase family protein, partial [Thermoplasmata archaeon]
MIISKIPITSIVALILLISNIPILSSSSINQESTMGSIIIEQDFMAPGDNSGSRASNFEYHNYSQLTEALKELNLDYPNLMELYNAQDLYGLPDCRDGYKIWIVRLTNESDSKLKPEVLYLGGHHGDEAISIEVPFYFIYYLLENYNNDPNIKYIIDNRELYIVPVLNPYGWEHNSRYDGNGEDVNRDYPYGNASDNEALTTVGASAVHELMKTHMFSAAISWHAGVELIYYAWGTPLHDTGLDESPDDSAYKSLGKRMSEYGGDYHGQYNYGPANNILYGAEGAWSDYAYAASWDSAGFDPNHPTGGSRTLAFGVEISNQKKPTTAELGTEIDLYCSPGEVKGYIPKNIRLGFALAELAQPYIEFQNKSLIPDEVEPGKNLTLTWNIGGAMSIDQT